MACGIRAADASLCEQAVKVQDAMIICAPVISQIAAEAAVRADWNYARAFAGDLAERRTALETALSAIPRLQWQPGAGGFFILARVEGCTDSVALANDILDRVQVVTIPGAAFGRASAGWRSAGSYRSSTGAAPRCSTTRGGTCSTST